MVGEEDEVGVERLGRLGARLGAEQHVEEVCRVAEVRLGRQDRLAGPQPADGRDDGGEDRDRPHRLAPDGVERRLRVIARVVVGAEERDRRPEITRKCRRRKGDREEFVSLLSSYELDLIGALVPEKSLKPHTRVVAQAGQLP